MFHDETASATQKPSFLSILRSSILTLVLLSSPYVHGEDFRTFGSDFATEEVTEYYTINEQAKVHSSGLDHAFTPMGFLEEMRTAALSVIAFIRHRRPIASPTERYRRASHFGTWRMHPDELGCYDVRGKVLERESTEPVQTRQSGQRCIVTQGRWYDPYTDQQTTSPSDLQIDHVVPLKNAYIMGAWKWSKEKRCWYANFLGTRYHLLPVDGRENMFKSDSTPADYVPPNANYQCDYLKSWLKIKMAWKLALVPAEVEAIHEIVTQNHCTDMTITRRELNVVRAEIQKGSPICDPRFLEQEPH